MMVKLESWRCLVAVHSSLEMPRCSKRGGSSRSTPLDCGEPDATSPSEAPTTPATDTKNSSSSLVVVPTTLDPYSLSPQPNAFDAVTAPTPAPTPGWESRLSCLLEISTLQTMVAQLQEQVKKLQAKVDEQDWQIAHIVQYRDATEVPHIQNLDRILADLQRQAKDQVALIESIQEVEKEVEDEDQAEDHQQKQHTKSWADVLKGQGVPPVSFISVTFTENRLYEQKALSVRVRGIPDTQDAFGEAKFFFTDTLHHDAGLDKAWRTHKDTEILVICFSSVAHRTDVLRRRAKLKDTRIFLDEDLTFVQVQERKQACQKAKELGKHLIYRDGIIRFVKIRVKEKVETVVVELEK